MITEELEFIEPEWLEFVKNLKRKQNDEATGNKE